MDVPIQVGLADRAPRSASPAFESAPEAAAIPPVQSDFDRAREINARRAQVENPELLRRLRSL